MFFISTRIMTSTSAKPGNWVCYDNAENKLQAHNTSHKRAKIGRRISSSKTKRYITSLFRKSRPHIPNGDTGDDEWTCHGRTLMPYTNAPLGNQPNAEGDVEYPGDSATVSAENREQQYPTSPTMVADDPDGGIFHNREVRDCAHPHGESSYVAVTPTIPERSTLRMVTPTTLPDAQSIQDDMV